MRLALYKHGNRWIINYDELELVVDEYLAKKDNEEADEDENKKPQDSCLNLRSNGLPAGSRTRNADLGGPGYIHLTTDSYQKYFSKILYQFLYQFF